MKNSIEPETVFEKHGGVANVSELLEDLDGLRVKFHRYFHSHFARTNQLMRRR